MLFFYFLRSFCHVIFWLYHAFAPRTDPGENTVEIKRGKHRGCQMVIAKFLDRMCLALWASGLWLRYTTLQNLIPSFPRIAPQPWRNPRKGNFAIWQHCEAHVACIVFVVASLAPLFLPALFPRRHDS